MKHWGWLGTGSDGGGSRWALRGAAESSRRGARERAGCPDEGLQGRPSGWSPWAMEQPRVHLGAAGALESRRWRWRWRSDRGSARRRPADVEARGSNDRPPGAPLRRRMPRHPGAGTEIPRRSQERGDREGAEVPGAVAPRAGRPPRRGMGSQGIEKERRLPGAIGTEASAHRVRPGGWVGAEDSSPRNGGPRHRSLEARDAPEPSPPDQSWRRGPIQAQPPGRTRGVFHVKHMPRVSATSARMELTTDPRPSAGWLPEPANLGPASPRRPTKPGHQARPPSQATLLHVWRLPRITRRESSRTERPREASSGPVPCPEMSRAYDPSPPPEVSHRAQGRSSPHRRHRGTRPWVWATSTEATRRAKHQARARRRERATIRRPRGAGPRPRGTDPTSAWTLAHPTDPRWPHSETPSLTWTPSSALICAFSR